MNHTDARPGLEREQFDALFTRVDNTGRWGELAQKGTLNLITLEVRLQAFQEVRDGGTVSLAHMSYRDQVYNALAAFGLDDAPARNNVGEMREGIVTRAVLVDVPRLWDPPHLEGDVIRTVADLEAWEERAGVRVRSGRRPADPLRPPGARGCLGSIRHGGSDAEDPPVGGAVAPGARRVRHRRRLQ